MRHPAPWSRPLERRAVRLSVDELVLYLGDRDEAVVLLRDLRLKAYDARHPPRVLVGVVDAWLRRRRNAIPNPTYRGR